MKKFAAVLILVFCSLFTASPALAQTAPDPQPCAFPKDTPSKNLSENPILSDTGDAPISIPYEFDSKGGNIVLPTRSYTFKIDFSKLQAIFAPSNSDYLEGSFQNGTHQTADVSNLDPKGINQYLGPNGKLSPKILTDQLKINYINYITSTNGNHLPEAANKITDLDGQNPKTIYDMYSAFQAPKPAGENQDPNTWGKYWLKIPTAWSEFYKGSIYFKAVAGQEELELIKKGCVRPPFNQINIILPEYFRTTQISDQTSRLMLPSSTQRDPKHQILAADFGENALATTISLCRDLLAKIPSSLGQLLGKAFQISLRLLDPVKPVYAENSALCIVTTNNPSAGQAPYCPLPIEEIQRINSIQGMHVDCSNANEQYNLQKNNQNVVCTFSLTWPGTYYSDANIPNPKDDFAVGPGPDCTQTGDNQFHCKFDLKIWPILNLPWTAEVWNNTTYGGGAEKKNPGFYSNFIPNSAIGQSAIPALDQPGKTLGASSDTDPRIRDLGAVNCAQKFTKDLALKPIALQQTAGISQNCIN